MKKKMWLCFVPIALVVCLAAGIFLLGIPTSYRAVEALKRTMELDKLSGTVSVQFGEAFQTDGEFYWCPVSEGRGYAVSAQGMELYFLDGKVYFGNGRGYDLESLEDELPDLDEFNLNALYLVGFKSEKLDSGTQYRLGLTEKTLSKLEGRYPGILALAGTELTMVEENGVITACSVTHPTLSIRASLNSDSQKTIPTEVLMTMTGENLRDIQSLSPLFHACMELAEKEVFGGDMSLHVDCGPLPIQDTAKVYGTRDAIYFTRGGSTSRMSLSGLDHNQELFLGLGWALCKDGELTENPDGSQIYTLTTDGDMLQNLFEEMLPELSGLDITIRKGLMSVTIQDQRLRAMSLACSGEMPFLIITIPMELSMEITRMPEPVTLPDNLP